jgi:hypothetical protein
LASTFVRLARTFPRLASSVVRLATSVLHSASAFLCWPPRPEGQDITGSYEGRPPRVARNTRQGLVRARRSRDGVPFLAALGYHAA